MPTLLDLYFKIMISQFKNATFPSEAAKELGNGNPMQLVKKYIGTDNR
jgi:hypothetical protein